MATWVSAILFVMDLFSCGEFFLDPQLKVSLVFYIENLLLFCTTNIPKLNLHKFKKIGFCENAIASQLRSHL